MSVGLAVQGARYSWRGREVLAQESGALVLAKVIDAGRMWPLDAAVLVDVAELEPLAASDWSEARLGQRAVTFWHPSHEYLQVFVGVTDAGPKHPAANSFQAALADIAAAELPGRFPVFIGDSYFRAVWLCQTPSFRRWANVATAKDARDFVCEIVGVKSLKGLDLDVLVNRAWRERVLYPYSEYMGKL